MDGVLVDSEGIFRDATMDVCAASGLELPSDVYMRMVGAPREQNQRVILEHFGRDFNFEAWIEAVNIEARSRMAHGAVLKPGARDLLNDLKAAGTPCAVATSSGHPGVERHLGPPGLLSYFQTIVARGDYERGKPHPDPFLLAAQRLGVAPESCLALEDSHNGVRAACAAGMMTIMVPDLLEPTPEMHSLCVAVASDLHEVQRILGRSLQGEDIKP